MCVVRLCSHRLCAFVVLEHIRQILLQMNELVVRLDGVCTAQSCPKMMATPEWEFLCATHPK